MRALGFATRLALSALVALAALSARASAQCGPDGLDGPPCCAPVTANLPAFPSITQQMRYVCFRDCGIAVNQQLCVTIGAPVQAACGVYVINFQIRTCGSNQLLWRGNIRAHYARNWQEFDPVRVHGVWRFLLNGDLVPQPVIASNTNPNIRPPCIVNFGRAYFSGYIDYALDCSVPGSWSVAWVLDHDCDRTTHVSGTARVIAAGSHRNRSYTFVGPSAGFVVDPANGPWIPGTITGESMRRNDWPNQPNLCLAEEIVLAPGLFTPQPPACDCMPNPPGSPAQYAATVVQSFGGCGSRFDTQNPPMGPFPFSQKAIGYWTTPLTFPSPSHLFVNRGTMIHGDGCTTSTTTQFVEGVTTLTSGVGLMSYSGTPLGNNVVDLATSNGVGGAVQISRPHVSWYLMGVNY